LVNSGIRILGNQGRSRTVYEIEFNGTIQYISVEVASNGYIVGANPTRRNLIRRFT
jgi:filamentous hemagglutinin